MCQTHIVENSIKKLINKSTAVPCCCKEIAWCSAFFLHQWHFDCYLLHVLKGQVSLVIAPA